MKFPEPRAVYRSLELSRPPERGSLVFKVTTVLSDGRALRHWELQQDGVIVACCSTADDCFRLAHTMKS
jgi:hypothetical protein